MENNSETNDKLDKSNVEKVENIKEPTDYQTKDKKSKDKTNLWLIIISVFLLALLVVNTISLIFTQKQNALENQRAEEYQKRVETFNNEVEEAQRLLDLQQYTISSLMDNYEAAVYDNPNVDNIYQQQFRAMEYMLMTLQITATQNSQIIQLLSTMP